MQSTSHGLDALFSVTPLDSRLQARYHGALTGDLRFQSLNATGQALVLCLQTLGLGAGGGELLSDRQFLLFLLPRIAGKVPQSDLSVRVKHRATGERVGRTTPPRLLSPIPRVAKRAPLRHVRHGWHLLPRRRSQPPTIRLPTPQAPRNPTARCAGRP